MLKKKKFTGYWFLPTKPDEKISGTLYFDPKGEIMLDLIGAFQKRTNFFLEKDETRYFPVIHGLDSDGQKFVLVYCYRKNYSFHQRTDVSVSSFRVRNIIRGDSFFDPERAVFSNVCLSFNYLNQWIGRNVIQESFFDDKNGKNDGFEFRFLRSKATTVFECQLNEDLLLAVKPFAGFSEKRPNETRIIENFEAQFVSAERLTYEEVRRLVIRLHSLIDLSFGDPTFFTYLNVGFKKEGKESPDNIEWFNVMFSQPNVNRNFKRALRVRFNYHQIQDNLDVILRNWFSFDPLLDPLIERLLLSQRQTDSLAADFNAVAQGLDGFHRRYFTKNQRDYEKRLKQLVDYCKGISNIDFSESELKIIAENRHYYTHLFAKEEYVLYSLDELYQKTEKLKALFFCCVMKKIGFTDKMLDWVGAEL